MSNVIPFPASRIKRIPIVYDDACLEFARRVELGLYEVIDPRPQKIADALKEWSYAMAGNRPSDTEPAA